MRLPRKPLPFVVALTAAAVPLSAQAHQRPRGGSGAEHRASAGASGLGSQITIGVSPAAPKVGAPTQLTVTGAPQGISDYRWDLTGDGAFARDTAGTPGVTTQFATAGAHRVAVQLRTSAGWVHAGAVIQVSDPTASEAPPVPRRHRAEDRSASEVPPAPRRHTAEDGSASAAPSAPRRRTAGDRTASAPRARPGDKAHHRSAGHASGAQSSQPRTQRTARTGAATISHSGTVRAAGDPPVTIADFSFAPGATTIHTGDTITWTNNGPSPHTATARDGSFNTGILQKGQSGSHTFTQAGTFSYYCTVHPFMHGTVVVLASSTGSQTTGSQTGGSQAGGSTGSGSGSPGGQNTTGSASSAAGATTTAGTAAPTAASTPSLPNTGMSLVAALAIAVSLLGAGLGLRRMASG